MNYRSNLTSLIRIVKLVCLVASCRLPTEFSGDRITHPSSTVMKSRVMFFCSNAEVLLFSFFSLLHIQSRSFNRSLNSSFHFPVSHVTHPPLSTHPVVHGAGSVYSFTIYIAFTFIPAYFCFTCYADYVFANYANVLGIQ